MARCCKTALPAFGRHATTWAASLEMLPRSPDLGPCFAQGRFSNVGPPPTVQAVVPGRRGQGRWGSTIWVLQSLVFNMRRLRWALFSGQLLFWSCFVVSFQRSPMSSQTGPICWRQGPVLGVTVLYSWSLKGTAVLIRTVVCSLGRGHSRPPSHCRWGNGDHLTRVVWGGKNEIVLGRDETR